MSIRVSCECGHAFRVKDKYAGRHGKCPGCGQMVRVPGEAPQAAKPPERKASQRSSGSERRHLVRILARSLVPKSLPELPALEMAGLFQPAREPGQDYCDCLQLHDGSWGLVVATVNARGLDAVQSALELRAATHALALGYNDPGAILSLLNRALVADWPQDRSATMLLIRLDPQTHYLSYASAGHPTAYVLDAQGRVKWDLESSNCPIGLLAQTMYGTSSPLRIEEGEAVLLFSDGLVKAPTSEGQPLGSSRLLRSAVGTIRLPAASMVEAIQQLLLRDRPHEIDRSLLLVKAR